MTRRVTTLRIDRLRLDRGAAGLSADLARDLEQAVQTALIARRDSTAPQWPAATRPALRRAAEALVARMPAAQPKDGA